MFVRNISVVYILKTIVVKWYFEIQIFNIYYKVIGAKTL